MILDAYSEVYVWEGWKPGDEDNMTGSARRRWDKNRQLAMRSALNYAQGKGMGVLAGEVGPGHFDLHGSL